MSQKRQIGDPLEQAATTGKIGGRQKPSRSDVQPSESSNIQTSEVSNLQTAKSSNVQKPKHKGREQQTIYLPPHLVRKLKLYKAMHDIEYSDIVAQALEDFFTTHQEASQ